MWARDISGATSGACVFMEVRVASAPWWFEACTYDDTSNDTLVGVARLADALCAEAGTEATCQAAQLRKGPRSSLVRLLAEYPLPVTGHEGYGKVSSVAMPWWSLRWCCDARTFVAGHQGFALLTLHRRISCGGV